MADEPTKLVQLIAAAEGAQSGDSQGNPENSLSFHLEESDSKQEAPAEVAYTLSETETIEALRLITRFGEIGADLRPKPEEIGLELHRSAENIRKTVLSVLDELSTTRDTDSKKPILMRAAEQMAIRYALERFQSGDLKVNAVHELLEQMGQQMGNLRNSSRDTNRE